jgi:putative transcriptional regulator
LKNRLEEFRKQQGIRQEELAEILEVSRQTIGSLENGRYNPSIILAIKIARFFGKSVEEIFIYEEEQKKMRKQSQPWLFVLGPVSLVMGIIMRALFVESESVTDHSSLLPVVLLGFGSSLTITGIVYFIVTKLIRIRNPKKAKQIVIEAKDERNVKLLEKSGYTTWYVTMITLVALSMTLVAMGFETAFWLSLGVFAIHVTVFFICGYIYDKKM